MEPTISRVSRIEARVAPHEWRWAAENRRWIGEHWAERVARQPRLFNGQVLLANERRLEDGVLRATFFRADYASFLAHKDAGFPDPHAANAFALAALRSQDGAFVLGVMAAHTANAGNVYFPAGTPDPADVTPDDRVDLAGSLVRELTEETGLDPASYDIEDDWTVVDSGPKVALFREVRLRDDGLTVERRILDHIAADPDAELAAVRLVRGPDDLDEAVMPAFLIAYLRDRFRG